MDKEITSSAFEKVGMSRFTFILCLVVLSAIFAPIVYLGWQIIGVAQ